MSELQQERPPSLESLQESLSLAPIPAEQSGRTAVDNLSGLHTDNLNDRCRICSETLRTCVKAAFGAAQIEYTFTKTKLRLIQNRLDEQRLRLDIWMSDCGVTAGDLSSITVDNQKTLTELLGSLFARLQEDLSNISRDIHRMEEYAKEDIQSTEISHVPQINDAEERILNSSDRITTVLVELANLQTSVQMAIAIHHDNGPDAALRGEILNAKAAFRGREEAADVEDLVHSVPIEDTESHMSSEESCPKCQLWFPWHALSLHMELCPGGAETPQNLPEPQAQKDTPLPPLSPTREQNPQVFDSPTRPSRSPSLSSVFSEISEGLSAEIREPRRYKRWEGSETFELSGIDPSGPVPASKNWMEWSCLRYDERKAYFRSLPLRERQLIKAKEALIIQRQDDMASSPSQQSTVKNFRYKLARWSKYPRPSEHRKRKDKPIPTNLEKANVIFLRGGYPYSDPQIPGSFPNQKVPVETLLRGNVLTKSSRDIISYVHFPSNNMSWVEEAIAQYHRHTPPAGEVLSRERWRGRFNDSSPSTRYLKPGCVADSPNSMSLFMPFLHWDTAEAVEMGRRTVRDLSIARLNSFRTAEQHVEEVELAVPSSRKIGYGGRLLGSLLMAAADIYRSLAFKDSEQLLRKFIFADPPLHPRRTLAQYSHKVLSDTTVYDQQQVLFREDTKYNRNLFEDPRHRDHEKKSRGYLRRLIMVDQLWLWVLDDNTIITSFPQIVEENYRVSNVHLRIRHQLAVQFLEKGSPHDKVNIFDIANIIVEQCSAAIFEWSMPRTVDPDIDTIFSRMLNSMYHDMEKWKVRLELSQFHANLFLKTPQETLASLEGSTEQALTDDANYFIRDIDTMEDVIREQERVLHQLHTYTACFQSKTAIQRRRYSFSMNLREIGQEANWENPVPVEMMQENLQHRRDSLLTLRRHAESFLQQVRHLYIARKDMIELLEAQATVKSSESTIKQEYIIAVLTVVILTFLPLIYLTLALQLTQPTDLVSILPATYIILVIGAAFAFSRTFRAAISFYLSHVSFPVSYYLRRYTCFNGAGRRFERAENRWRKSYERGTRERTRGKQLRDIENGQGSNTIWLEKGLTRRT